MGPVGGVLGFGFVLAANWSSNTIAKCGLGRTGVFFLQASYRLQGGSRSLNGMRAKDTPKMIFKIKVCLSRIIFMNNPSVSSSL